MEANNHIYNLYTSEHGNHDRSWENYIDYIPSKGIIFDSFDYTYPHSYNRKAVLDKKAMTEIEKEEARAAAFSMLVADRRIYTPAKWIGSSRDKKFSIPCKVIRSPKYKGNATLISIKSVNDRYERECYKAVVVSGDNYEYEVSPTCVIIEKKLVTDIISQCSNDELLSLLDEIRWGHWNYGGYNDYLFGIVELFSKYAPPAIFKTRSGKAKYLNEKEQKEIQSLVTTAMQIKAPTIHPDEVFGKICSVIDNGILFTYSGYLNNMFYAVVQSAKKLYNKDRSKFNEIVSDRVSLQMIALNQKLEEEYYKTDNNNISKKIIDSTKYFITQFKRIVADDPDLKWIFK